MAGFAAMGLSFLSPLCVDGHVSFVIHVALMCTMFTKFTPASIRFHYLLPFQQKIGWDSARLLHSSQPLRESSSENWLPCVDSFPRP